MNEWLDIPGYPEYQINSCMSVRRCHVKSNRYRKVSFGTGTKYRDNGEVAGTLIWEYANRQELWDTAVGDGEWRELKDYPYHEINAELQVRKVKPLKQYHGYVMLTNEEGERVHMKVSALWQIAKGKEVTV